MSYKVSDVFNSLTSKVVIPKNIGKTPNIIVFRGPKPKKVKKLSKNKLRKLRGEEYARKNLESQRLQPIPNRLVFKEKQVNQPPRLKAKDYTKYIKSKAWLRRRLDYFKKFGRKCVICRATNINLHHVSYVNLGREKDEDLILLCKEHHERLHERVITKREMHKETYQFVREEIEELEMGLLAKNL